MADPVTSPAAPMPTPAAKAGNETSEYFLTKIIVFTATVVAILSEALDVVNTFAGWIPKDSPILKGIAITAAVVAFLKSTVYTLSRTRVKVVAMQTGSVPDLTPAQAAEILDGKGPSAPAVTP